MKTKIYFGFLALLFALGCSNEELINDSSDNNQFRKGNGVNSILFNGTSILIENIDNYYPLTELNGETDNLNLSNGKFMRYGKFSGQITGCGKIISNSSTYTFTAPQGFTNTNYNPTDSFNEFSHNYDITATGIISVGRNDNCEITITGVLEPYYYAFPEYTYGNNFGGLIGNGVAIITNGSGRLKKLNGTYEVHARGMDYFGINLSTGEIGLWIGPKIE